MGRELCLFLSVDATRVPAKQRASFIALAVRRAAPFPDPAHEAAWSGAHAGVWYWSRSRVAELLGPQPLRVARVVPEAQYCGEPMAEGAQLLALARGFEGRAWKDAGLVADRWWAVPPSGEDWAAFLRGAGLRVMELPDAVEAPIGQTPWAQQRQGTRLALDDAGTWLRRGAVAAGAIACLAIGFESGAGLRGLTDVRASERARQQLDAPLTRILEARADAERGVEDLQQMMALRAPRGQMAMLAEIRRIMPSQDWRIVQWQQTAVDRLEVIFAVESVDATALVSAWETSPMFTNVSSSVEEAAKRVTIRATVVGTVPPAGMAPDNAGALQ
ncbi:hypothetical protein [uncultured Luteimonas sp.]|uniref:hypothetical protein n=1 Tax=uncultured Luteimonas sp. TaxID=453144 RepID=UPI0026265061|nr:hypothetical protein [uncultured Luteimonas sp.]